MIIDSHVHIGVFYGMKVSRMPQEMVLQSMKKYGIDYSLVSNGSGCEVDGDLVELPPDKQRSQEQINDEIIAFAKENPKKIGALLWAKPLNEGCDQVFEGMVVNNRDVVKGIKIHPYHSKTAFNSPKVRKYIELADRCRIPVLTHTACDYESSPALVYEMAMEYPGVNFIMAHMGLATDNEEAIKLISKCPNLYGDTAWVSYEKTCRAIDVCGIDKILFGTDNPINGLDTYNDEDFYNHFYTDLKKKLPPIEYDKFMYKNAARLYHLDF